ncbi:MAG: formate dehydrogenase accessory sulfurtransferase FdhD [Bacteroidetes bacterium]|nr:formate dehydrogenase accessory sulfurtransferase FdhD [Bacteroidota bacterium]
MSISPTTKVFIRKIDSKKAIEMEDVLAVEEPLEIRLAYGPLNARIQKSISVTMRTPGNDVELGLGFLFTEGVIKSGSEIKNTKHLDFEKNLILFECHENSSPSIAKLERNFYTTSSCGVCGKSSIDAIRIVCEPIIEIENIQVSMDTIVKLPEQLREQQSIFESTGGLHASALFDLDGKFVALREDVGRHNALDKLIGFALASNLLHLQNHILVLSGRASFELIQKAAMANIKVIAAVGAPSSLAVQLAQEFGITLIGFLRGERFNIYSNKQRIKI